jgi:hypothetical protein
MQTVTHRLLAALCGVVISACEAPEPTSPCEAAGRTEAQCAELVKALVRPRFAQHPQNHMGVRDGAVRAWTPMTVVESVADPNTEISVDELSMFASGLAGVTVGETLGLEAFPPGSGGVLDTWADGEFHWADGLVYGPRNQLPTDLAERPLVMNLVGEGLAQAAAASMPGAKLKWNYNADTDRFEVWRVKKVVKVVRAPALELSASEATELLSDAVVGDTLETQVGWLSTDIQPSVFRLIASIRNGGASQRRGLR